MVVGDDVEVLGGVQRDVHARPSRPTCLRPLARAVHHDLGLDVTGVGAHTGDPAVRVDHTGHPGVLDDPRATQPRALGQRLRQVGRVGLAVGGQPDRPDQVVDPHHRPVLQRLLGREQFTVQVEGGRVGRGAAQLHHPVLGARDRHPAALLVAGRQPGLGLEFGVQLRRVLHQPGATLRRAQLADQPRRMPGRSRGQLTLLEQHDIGFAELGQVVGDAGADDAAADDDDPGAVGKCGCQAGFSFSVGGLHVVEQPVEVGAR